MNYSFNFTWKHLVDFLANEREIGVPLNTDPEWMVGVSLLDVVWGHAFNINIGSAQERISIRKEPGAPRFVERMIKMLCNKFPSREETIKKVQEHLGDLDLTIKSDVISKFEEASLDEKIYIVEDEYLRIYNQISRLYSEINQPSKGLKEELERQTGNLVVTFTHYYSDALFRLYQSSMDTVFVLSPAPDGSWRVLSTANPFEEFRANYEPQFQFKGGKEAHEKYRDKGGRFICFDSLETAQDFIKKCVAEYKNKEEEETTIKG